jgi:hypothetical protein
MELCQRFTIQKTIGIVTIHSFSCDNIYNIPSPMKKKGTAIGYGNKSDFTKDLTASPGATRYRLDTLFDKNRKSKKGFSMYENR